MARSFTLGTLVTRCKERADMESAEHIDDTEWKGYISTVYAKLYAILAGTGLRYFETVQSISSASLTDNGDGGKYVALPSDHFMTIGVDYLDSSNLRTALDEMMVQERNLYSGMTGAAQAEAYSLVGVNLVLYPGPPSGQTYKHLYVPQPTDYSSSADGTSVNVVTADGEDFIIWGVVIMALAKEESDTSVAERRFAMAKAELQEWAALRSLNSMRRRIVDNGPERFDPADWRR